MTAVRYDNKYDRMTKTPVERLIVELSIPTIISMMVTALYNSADTYFVGTISTQATASVGIVFSVMSVIQALGFFCGHGSGNYMSRQIGAGNKKEAEEAAATGFVLSILIGLTVTVTGLIFLRPLAHLLGATPSLIEDTVRYMRIILCGAAVMMPQLVINNQLRFQGSGIYAMAGLVSGSLINIVLDPVLIFVCGMGVSGAALATVISQAIALCVLWAGTLRGENVRLKVSNIRLNGHYLKEIINGGMPSLFRQGMSSISTVVLNRMGGAYGGDAAIAGMSIVTRVMWIANSAVIGFGQGLQPVVSFNYGAKLYGRVKKGYLFCVRYATYFLSVMAVLCLLFAPKIIAFFREDAEVVLVGAPALRFQALAFFVFGFSVMSNMMLQSMGKGVRASILAASRSGIFFLPAILILPLFFGILGVETAQPVADFFAALIAVPIVRSVWKELADPEAVS